MFLIRDWMNHGAAATADYIFGSRLAWLARYLTCFKTGSRWNRWIPPGTSSSAGPGFSGTVQSLDVRNCHRRPRCSHTFVRVTRSQSYIYIMQTVILHASHPWRTHRWTGSLAPKFRVSCTGRALHLHTSIAYWSALVAYSTSRYNECHHICVLAHSHTHNSFFLSGYTHTAKILWQCTHQ